MMLSEIGLIIFSIGWVWLMYIAIILPQRRLMKVVWFLVNLITAPLGSLIFYLINRKGLVPLILTAIGFIILIASLIISGNEVQFEVMN